VRIEEERFARKDEPELGEGLKLSEEQEQKMIDALLGPNQVELDDVLGVTSGVNAGS